MFTSSDASCCTVSAMSLENSSKAAIRLGLSDDRMISFDNFFERLNSDPARNRTDVGSTSRADRSSNAWQREIRPMSKYKVL